MVLVSQSQKQNLEKDTEKDNKVHRGYGTVSTLLKEPLIHFDFSVCKSCLIG